MSDEREIPRASRVSVVFHALTLVLLGALLAIAISPQWQSLEEPVIPHAQRFLETQAMAGQIVTLEIDRTRVRYCPGAVDEFWRDERFPHRVIQGHRVPASPGTKLGRIVSELQKKIPETATAGRWCYTPIIRYECPDRVYEPVWTPACIEVVK